MQEEQRLQMALWRVGVLGPLVSARLHRGELRQLCKESASRHFVKPNGQVVRLSPRTIEDWHYRYRRGGLDALKPRSRTDRGRSRAIPEPLANLILTLKREQPRRSIRAIIRMLERAGEVRRGELKKSTVHRLLRAHQVSRRPARSSPTERRAFRHAHAGACGMGDVAHGPQAFDERGRLRKAYLHVIIDSATRVVPGTLWRAGERAVDFEATLKQAVMKHGVPRVFYVDRGAAQTATSLRLICAELGIYLRHCRPYDAAAKGGVERFIRTLRGEVVDELPEEPLSLAQLNALTWSWVSMEYHRRRHGGTGRIPLEHWLEQAEHLRPAPAGKRLDEIFLHRERRKVRKDGTVRFRGRLLEVQGELSGKEIELRFHPERAFRPEDPSTLPRVYEDGRFLCDTLLLDPVANSTTKRRKLAQDQTPKETKPKTPSGIDPLGQLADEQARLRRAPRKPATDEE